MTKTSKDLRVTAKKLGATIEKWRGYGELKTEVIAPDGYVWGASGTHILIDHQSENYDPVPLKPDYDDILNRMSYGLEPCEAYADSDCEWCNSDASTGLS